MPLRYVKRRLTGQNVLTVAIATTSVTYELADMLQFPPARAATGILLLIFQTIQDVQSNRDECYRLARRCLKLLTDLRDAMDGRWEDAPEPLLKAIAKFERTLQSIHDDLKKESEQKWRSRLMRKNTIETALAEYNVLVDDAARSFQIATLIHIHHAIGRSFNSSSKSSSIETQGLTSSIGASNPFTDSAAICDTPRSMTFSASDLVSYPPSERSSSDNFTLVDDPNLSIANAVPAAIFKTDHDEEVKAEADALEDKGFRRYHQSEVVVRAPSRIKSGWWAGGRDAHVNGRQLMMLSYEGPYGQAAKRWMRDVKTLQNVYHPNLPQMVGYSGTDAPTPFILLANVQTRLPQARVQDALKNASLLDCARLLIRFYKDVFDAAIYMQRQLSLTDSKIQDYVEYASFRIEGYDTMVMGLPPPEVHNLTSYRNFGLAHSIRDIFIQLIPHRGLSRKPYDPEEAEPNDLQLKIDHLGLLARSIFPSGDDSLSSASSRLDELIGDDDDEEAEPLSLPMIRMAGIRARTHGQSWANTFCQAHQFSVGDVVYVPKGDGDERQRWKEFVKVGNLLEDGVVELETTEHATGWKTLLEFGRIDKEDLQSFVLPGNVYGWPLVMEAGTRQNVQVVHEKVVRYVSDAWKALLSHASGLAAKHGVEPHDLVLVTRAGIDQRFVIHDVRQVPPAHLLTRPHYNMHGHRPGFPASGAHSSHHHHHLHHHQMRSPFMPGSGTPPPAIIYAFTSITQEHEACISDGPMYVPPTLQAQSAPKLRQCIWGAEGVYGFMNYVQLHREDFI